MKLPVPLLPKSIRWLGVLALAVFIFYASLVTVPETVVDETQPEGRILIEVPLHLWRHIVAYSVFAGALAYATDHWDISRWHNAALVIGIAALYGICMEFGQSLVPHRTDFLITDAAANTLGASGVLIWYAIRPYLDLRPLPELLDQFKHWYTTR